MLHLAFVFVASVFLQIAAQASAESILYIGDSHTAGNFGSHLEALLKAAGASVTRTGIVGSRAPAWSAPKGLSQLQKTESYSAVIIALGTNDLASFCRNPSAAVKDAIDLLTKVKPEQKCIWVGPPLLSASHLLKECGGEPGMQKFREAYKAGIQGRGCQYVDSSKSLIYPNSTDGVHFSGKAAERWAQYIYTQISDSLKPESKSTPTVQQPQQKTKVFQ